MLDCSDNEESLLKWWKEHARLLLYLSRLACWYLAMQVTNAPVERLFLVAGQVVTAKKASLDLHTVKLICVSARSLPSRARDDGALAPNHQGYDCCVTKNKTNI